MTQSMPRQRPFRRQLLCAGIALPALLSGSFATAEPAAPIKIPAGSLESALLAISAQTHQQVLFPRDLVAGKTAPALSGTYSAEQAIRMLMPTDISISRAGPAVLVLKKATDGPGSPPNQGDNASRPFGVEGAPATGAEAPTPSAREDMAAAAGAATTVSEVAVTGTHIRGGVSAAPLLVVSHADLERTGQTTVADALRTLPQNYRGGAGEGTSLTGADNLGRNLTFATGLNLRGLGNNATLVLIDGRRMAGSGAFGDFSDVSAIPAAAVERVEVLLDGASAVYGSDAVGGVVNIILRKDFDGAETRILAGTSTEGGASEGQISQVFGNRWASGSVLFAYEGRTRDPLTDADRRFTATSDLRALGGTDRRITNSAPGNILNASLAPAFAIPAGQNGVGLKPSDLLPGVVNLQNQRLGEDVLPSQTSQSLYASVTQDLGSRLTLSGDARYSFRAFKARQPSNISTLSVTNANPFYVAPTGAASEFIGYSFANDLPNPTTAGSAETIGATLGGTLKLAGDWQSRAYLTFAQEIDELRGSGVINSFYLSEALGNVADRPTTAYSPPRDGYFNPFGGRPGVNNPIVLAAIGSGFLNNRGKDQVSSANLQADGTIWTLPGGPLRLAIGAQARREALYRTGATYLTAAAPVASAPIDVSRDVEAAYAELQIPLVGTDNARPGFQRLELSLAGRVEHYEKVGSTSNPKVGVLWEPTDGLIARGTYGTSFRAPALREVNDPALYSPTNFPLGTARVRTLLLAGGNPDLRPETATTWTVGFDLAPRRWPGLTVGATWYDIQFRNRIGSPVSQNLVFALTDPTLTSFVTRISPTTNAADLAKITELLSNPAVTTTNGVFPPTAFGAIVDSRYVNATAVHVEGIDLIAAYHFDVGADRIDLAANGSYMFKFEQQVTPTSATVNEVGLVNFPVRFRGRATADWTHNRLTAGVALNYASAYHDLAGQRIDSDPTVDLQLRMAPADHGVLQKLAVTLNVRNVFDRDPPFYDNPLGYGYDPSNGDPIGRFVSLQLVRAW